MTKMRMSYYMRFLRTFWFLSRNEELQKSVFRDAVDIGGTSQVALVVKKKTTKQTKKTSANAGDLRDPGSIPGSRQCPGGERL